VNKVRRPAESSQLHRVQGKEKKVDKREQIMFATVVVWNMFIALQIVAFAVLAIMPRGSNRKFGGLVRGVIVMGQVAATFFLVSWLIS
jgi:hypothetical protein